MEILGIIIVGFLAGLLARYIKPGDDKMGLLATTAVGIVGALIGTYLGQALGLYRAGEPAGFVGAVIGAILVLAVLKMVFRRKGSAFAS